MHGRAQGSNRWRRLGRGFKNGRQRIALAPHPLSDGEDFEVRYEIAPCCNARIRITEDMARFIGLFAGDGSHYENTVSIVCDGDDVDVIEEVGRLCVSLLVFSLRRVLSARRAEGLRSGSRASV